MVRGDLNNTFYGREVSPMQILNGSVSPPAGSCDVLYNALQRATRQATVAVPPPVRSSSSSIPVVTAVPVSTAERNSDPRLSRYKSYKSEKELYEEFHRRKSSSDMSLDLPPPAQASEKQAIFTRVIDLVESKSSQPNVALFKENCRLFGQDQLPLGAYFGYLRTLGSTQFLSELIPQLVRLLPTEQKRKDIWHLYTTQIVNKV